MLIEKTAWPQNKTCAAMISVNLDAEFFGKILLSGRQRGRGRHSALGAHQPPLWAAQAA